MDLTNSQTKSTPAPLSVAALNELHRKHWSEQSKLMERRISDPLLYKSAMETLTREESKGIELKRRESLESALEMAEKNRIRFASIHSRLGGKAPKADALQKLIRQAVLANEKITEKELLKFLKTQDGEGVIDRIDEKSIHFVTKGKILKSAPISGLKDRLTRAKKEINSR
jgi:hypothetical protein